MIGVDGDDDDVVSMVVTTTRVVLPPFICVSPSIHTTVYLFVIPKSALCLPSIIHPHACHQCLCLVSVYVCLSYLYLLCDDHIDFICRYHFGYHRHPEEPKRFSQLLQFIIIPDSRGKTTFCLQSPDDLSLFISVYLSFCVI